ncbi:MAG: hypothetical protein ACE5GJ_12245 [Gemmatimonadota bacterium]
MTEISLNPREMPWEESASYPTGTKIKVLYDEGERRTALLKLPPGFEMGDHAHTTHGPCTSKKGAELLVAWGA